MSINLMQGDCLERMKEIPDGSVDMVLTDPPYGTTACKWDTVIDLPLMWEQLKRVIKPNGAIVMTACQPFTSALVMSNPRMFKYCWVWNKKQGGNPLNAKRQPLRVTEDIVVFNSGGYIPQMRTGRMRKKGGINKQPETTGAVNLDYVSYSDQYYPTNILDFPNCANKKYLVHPTQKPVALMEYLIRTYTNEGETVLDFTCGSGTTGVACVNTARDFIGIELDQGYFDIAQQRIAEATKQEKDHD
jgi:site-specific DNA-methyltransferase (adenine-specific)